MWAQPRNDADGRNRVGDPTNADADTVTGAAQLFRVGNEIHFSASITYNTMHSLLKMLKDAETEMLAAERAAKAKVSLSDTEATLVDVKVTARPLLLFITSFGGSVFAALSVVDAIARLKVPVHTVVSGYAASAGTLLSMAGTKRFITPHSFMMVHELRSGFWGKYSDARVEGENMDKLMAMIVRFYAKRSKFPEAELQGTLSRDRNWDADECMQHGLVDEVLVASKGSML